MRERMPDREIATQYGTVTAYAQDRETVYIHDSIVTVSGVAYSVSSSHAHLEPGRDPLNPKAWSHVPPSYRHWSLGIDRANPSDWRKREPTEAAKAKLLAMIGEIGAAFAALYPDDLTEAERRDVQNAIDQRQQRIAAHLKVVEALRTEVATLSAGGRCEWREVQLSSGHREKLEHVVTASGDAVVSVSDVGAQR